MEIVPQSGTPQFFVLHSSLFSAKKESRKALFFLQGGQSRPPLHCHSEAVTESLSWESVLLNYRKENGLPRQCEHWLAMTEQGMRAAGHMGPAAQNSTAPFNSCRQRRHTSTLHASLLSLSLQKESLAALFLLYSSFSARYRATKMPLALAWDREWVTPLPSPMTNRPLWGVSRCSSSATSML